MTASTVDKIMDTAESQVRAGGYNSFSFREISKEIGIKSASIHYHFPTKTDLGVAVASRYTDRFMQQLTALSDTQPEPRARLEGYIDLFRQALITDRKMCLCGQLASESDVLPEAIQQETRRFFELNQRWLEQNLFADNPNAVARGASLVATLEGALMMSKLMANEQLFEDIVAGIAL